MSNIFPLIEIILPGAGGKVNKVINMGVFYSEISITLTEGVGKISTGKKTCAIRERIIPGSKDKIISHPFTI
ncbi:hypothetical protein ES708_33890 [subsurface metagenome]